MATCLPYKSAWVPIISVPIIDNLHHIANIFILVAKSDHVAKILYAVTVIDLFL